MANHQPIVDRDVAAAPSSGRLDAGGGEVGGESVAEPRLIARRAGTEMRVVLRVSNGDDALQLRPRRQTGS